eukprot:CAMPEP_0197015742 /NCGR_PEP_ID=MMETSP1380-20130617/75479_1 /TAXON_ID=5936 /ORGANISM="Euplotes crassus, Strain CT5" /LENGTH=60 /DNA_ID=CAMNT_0042441907 /DNA_START=1116 /DNA_END=1298 /DNA_ORIENTATION=+
MSNREMEEAEQVIIQLQSLIQDVGVFFLEISVFRVEVTHRGVSMFCYIVCVEIIVRENES